MFQENCEQPLKHCHYGLSLFGHCMTERSVMKVFKAFGKHFKQLIFPNHVYPSKLLDMANHCKNETQLTLPAVTKLDLRKLNQAVQHMRDLKRLEVQLSSDIKLLLVIKGLKELTVQVPEGKCLLCIEWAKKKVDETRLCSSQPFTCIQIYRLHR